ncbi:diacylglycerol/lipid kinase family protein [Naasia aerilata]|uniref:Sphingosine kinase n=1 Tax=Naasia aerilata TaxID=1162966 RepID=A0ABN6XRH2_9MICO|nr:diacylglycerol kinase family protein [Naasia aerilata]BDZ46250.1 sphingosine kinase [Naasia aerilata]
MQDRRRLLVAVNPSASFGKNRAVGPLVLERLRAAGHDVTELTRPSMAQLHEATAAALAADRPDALVVVGGDGMVHFGAQHTAGGTLPLGIIAAGTGNDVARGLGLPRGDPERAVDALLAALDRPARRIDAIRVTGPSIAPLWVAGAVSAGFDALVNERANLMRFPRGGSRYTVAILRELLALRPLEYTIEVDGERRSERGVLLSVANNRYIGGGMHITPGALLDDGELDVLLVSPIGRLRFLALFPRVFSGRHVGLSVVRIERVRRITVDAAGPIAAYGDGERLGDLPLTFEVVPGALPLLL